MRRVGHLRGASQRVGDAGQIAAAVVLVLKEIADGVSDRRQVAIVVVSEIGGIAQRVDRLCQFARLVVKRMGGVIQSVGPADFARFFIAQSQGGRLGGKAQ